MRKVIFLEGEYFHICHRGNNKQDIFYSDSDRLRFLFLILYFQSPETFANLSDWIKICLKQNGTEIERNLNNKSVELEKKILDKRIVNLINFALMPNHFHLTLQTLKDEAISLYMQRVLTSYTKYINIKYEKVGHLFQGPFTAVHINDDDQLMYLSAYIHLNPRELTDWHGKEDEYPWSSYQDYTNTNRWGKLLAIEHVLENFRLPNEYSDFVKNSGAKELDEELKTCI